jgi:hypothetical protein
MSLEITGEPKRCAAGEIKLPLLFFSFFFFLFSFFFSLLFFSVDPAIKDALFRLKDGGSHHGWVLLGKVSKLDCLKALSDFFFVLFFFSFFLTHPYSGYVPKQNVIKVKEEGVGLLDLKDSLSDGSIYWAYFRWDSDTLPKFVYISWCGEGVTVTNKVHS